MPKAFTWLCIKKKTHWYILGSPSFTGVWDHKSAQKVENRENVRMRKAFPLLFITKRVGISKAPLPLHVSAILKASKKLKIEKMFECARH